MSEAGLYTFWVAVAALGVVGPLRYRRGFRSGRRSFWPVMRWLVPSLALVGAAVVHVRIRELLPGVARLPLDALFAWCAVASVLTDLIKPAGPEHATAYRLAVRLPAQVFLAGSVMCTGWLLVLAPLRGMLLALGAGPVLDALAWADFLPVAVAAGSTLTTTRDRAIEWVHVALAKDGPERIMPVSVRRERRRRGSPPDHALRIVQITDPHLGPWQPVAKLRRHIERLIQQDPHLVLLTGDYLTVDTNAHPEALTEALSPLARLPGRCYACFGNHDHEAPDAVRQALAANGVELLVDDEAVAQTEVGPVQILGADYYRGEQRPARLRRLLAEHPRRSGHPRLLLLHDPSGFADIPPGEVDLTLSGHTHGGHVGLVGLGVHWTVVKRFGFPDQGLFAHGSNRLYVHRGTGHYGFPIRVGVPREASLLVVDTERARLRETEPPHEG